MIKEQPIDDVSEFIEEVDRFYDSLEYHAGSIWFRGLTKPTYKLIPSVLRRDFDEDSMIDDFLVNYGTLSDNKISDLWGKYALMQHYGLPTRLLDWTKSPLIALFFALLNHDQNTKRVIWAIDPYYLNKKTYDSEFVFVPATYDQTLPIKMYDFLPKALRNTKNIPKYPLAVETPYTNQRILFQQGCFTVHGTNTATIDSYFDDDNHIRKFVISGKKRIKSMQNTLFNMGIKEEYVMQDLQSLSQRIVRERS